MMKPELSRILAIDRKGRLILNHYDLELDFITIVIGLWDETLFDTKDLKKQT